MAILCCKCFNNNPKDIIANSNSSKKTSKKCQIFDFCTMESRVQCASESCKKIVCANHRNVVCMDCSLMHLASAFSNYSEKINSKKICV